MVILSHHQRIFLLQKMGRITETHSQIICRALGALRTASKGMFPSNAPLQSRDLRESQGLGSRKSVIVLGYGGHQGNKTLYIDEIGTHRTLRV